LEKETFLAGIPLIVSGKAKFAELNGDGFLDIIVSGEDPGVGQISTIFLNNQDGSFTIQYGTDFCDAGYSDFDYGDMDNDGDLDILHKNYWNINHGTGVDGPDGYIQVYKNNLADSFDLVFSEEEYDFHSYSLWGDYDNDGWLDFIVSSVNGAKVYKNMSNGNAFTEQTNESIIDFEIGVLKFGDCDNDGDIDLLVNGGGKTKLYINNTSSANTAPVKPAALTSSIYSDSIVLQWGKGSDANTPAEGLSYNIELIRGIDEKIVSPTSADNGYRKIVRRGNANLDTFYILRNLKHGKYRWRVQTIDNGFLASGFTDFKDFYIGEEAPIIDHSPKFPILFENTTSFQIYVDNIGQGTISYSIENEGTWFQLSESSGSDSTLINLSCSVNNAAYRKGKVFIIPDDPQIPIYTIEVAQKGSNIFTKVSTAQFEAVTSSSISWGDCDNDNDLDLILTGKINTNNNCSRLYINNDDGSFTEDNNFDAIEVKSGYTEWNDYNNDGMMDLLICGDTDVGGELLQTKLYKNMGNGELIEAENVEFPGIYYGGANFGDFNNDGRQDMAMTGISNNNDFSGLFINTGSGFFLDTLNNFPKSKYGGISWFDYDKDGLLDFLQFGDNQGGAHTYLQKNSVGGIFDAIEFPWARKASFIDINEDDYIDMLIKSDFYVADEVGNFELIEPQHFPFMADHCWGDYDNDGDLDIVFRTSLPTNFLFFENFDNKSFRHVASIIDEEYATISSMQFVDFNHDGRLDLFLVGYDNDDNLFSNLYMNNYYRSNQKPQAPSILNDSIYSETVYLKWNGGADEETNENCLFYNFYLYKENGDTIVNSMSDKETGFLKTISQGNANKNKHWHIMLEEPGTYFWSVQTIDYSNEGSIFAPVKQFTITEFLAFKEEMQHLNWEVGNTYPIVWEEAFLAYVKLEYSTDGGNTWEMISDSINADEEVFEWQVPIIEPGDCLLKISNTKYGLADTVLINIIPNIELTAPDSGLSIQTNRELLIEWASINSAYVNLDYRLEGDPNWNLIQDNIPSQDSTYLWNIPNLEPHNYYLRVADLQYPLSSDVAQISLLPYLKLLGPSEDEELVMNTLYNITWEYNYLDSIRIDYFEINSIWWSHPVAEAVDASSQAYSWLVPANTYQSDLIIVLKDLTSTVSDTSGIFTITTSVEEILKYNVFEIYPNPAKDILNLSFYKLYDHIDVQLIDLQEKTVHHSILQNDLHYALKLDLFEKGTYLVRIIVDNKTYEKKVVLLSKCLNE